MAEASSNTELSASLSRRMSTNAARTALVTGARGNLGRALAAAYAALGTRLVLVGRDDESLHRAFGPDSALHMTLAVDLVDRRATTAAVDKALARFGRIDTVCHLAGGFRAGEKVHEMAEDSWDFLVDMNVRTLLNVAHAVVPHMIRHGGGAIVNVASAAAGHGTAQMGAYSAAKSSVVRLTESMAAELREHGINVNCVLPTIIDTPENRAAMPRAAFDRWVSPQALADVIVFLASPAARAIHGAALPVVGLV